MNTGNVAPSGVPVRCLTPSHSWTLRRCIPSGGEVFGVQLGDNHFARVDVPWRLKALLTLLPALCSSLHSPLHHQLTSLALGRAPRDL